MGVQSYMTCWEWQEDSPSYSAVMIALPKQPVTSHAVAAAGLQHESLADSSWNTQKYSYRSDLLYLPIVDDIHLLKSKMLLSKKT